LYCHDSRDPQKQAIAQNLMATERPFALVWQIGCEFLAASRTLIPLGFTAAQAWGDLADMRLVADAIVLPVPEIWTEAQSLQTRHMLSFWDSLLVAACVRGGVTLLYTEEMGAPRMIDGLSLVNPFLPTPSP